MLVCHSRGGMVENFQARKGNVWLVAGPWQHGMPAGQYADIGTGAFLAWWDHWLARRPAHRTSGWCSAPTRSTRTSCWRA